MSIGKYFKRGFHFVLKGQPIVKNSVTANITSLSPNDLLKGRCALVTGGTSGIGKEIAKSFIEAGAFVVITGRNQAHVDDVCKEIEDSVSKKKNIKGVALNNRNTNSFQETIHRVLEICPNHQIDILVNNAGILSNDDFGNANPEEFDAVLETNLKGTFFLSQLVAHHMKDNHIKGNILNIASSSSLRPAASAYTISKWGIRGLTLGMAKMLAPYHIVVNGIAPGPTATPMLMRQGVKENIYNSQSITGRYIKPEEIANMAVILVSNMSRMIVGDIIYMTGGAGLLTTDDINYSFK